MKPQKGQLYEFYNGSTEETRTYELTSFEDPTHTKGARARLRNVESDRFAEVTISALSRKPGPTGSVWRFAAHSTTQPMKEKAGAAA